MAETTRPRSTDAPRRLDVAPLGGLRPGRRRVQVPQLVVALLLVAVGALATAVLYSQASARRPVLATADVLLRGEVVAAEDLRTVYVGSDDVLSTLAPAQLGSLVGQVVLADLKAGTIVTASLFADRNAVGDGEGIVGLSLPPGGYPTVQLTPGDVVDVVDRESAGGVVAEGAVVFDVVDLGVQGQQLISLRLPAEAAVLVASLPEDRIRLVLVSEAGR